RDSVRLITDGTETFCHIVDEVGLLLQYLGGGSGRSRIGWPRRRRLGQYGQERDLNGVVKRLELEKPNRGLGVGLALEGQQDLFHGLDRASNDQGGAWGQSKDTV